MIVPDLSQYALYKGGHVGMEHGVMGGSSGMHGPGQGMGDSHGARQGMWGGPGGMHHPHGQGNRIKSLLDDGPCKAKAIWFSKRCRQISDIPFT